MRFPFKTCFFKLLMPTLFFKNVNVSSCIQHRWFSEVTNFVRDCIQNRLTKLYRQSFFNRNRRSILRCSSDYYLKLLTFRKPTSAETNSISKFQSTNRLSLTFLGYQTFVTIIHLLEEKLTILSLILIENKI